MKPHRKQNNNPREWTSEISETRSRGILFLTAEYGQGKRGGLESEGEGSVGSNVKKLRKAFS